MDKSCHQEQGQLDQLQKMLTLYQAYLEQSQIYYHLSKFKNSHKSQHNLVSISDRL